MSTHKDYPRVNRLLKPVEFRKVFNKPRKLHRAGFSLFVAKNSVSYPRLGLAIAKKNVRRAVDRNRIKRVVRESFRHHKSELEGFDIVFLARQPINQQDNQSLFAELSLLWKKLNQTSGAKY